MPDTTFPPDPIPSLRFRRTEAPRSGVASLRRFALLGLAFLAGCDGSTEAWSPVVRGEILFRGGTEVRFGDVVRDLRSGTFVADWTFGRDAHHQSIQPAAWTVLLKASGEAVVAAWSGGEAAVDAGLLDSLLGSPVPTDLQVEIRNTAEGVALEPSRPLRWVDDRPLGAVEARLSGDGIRHHGDTVELEVVQRGEGTLDVFVDHAGLRSLGDDVVRVEPGAKAVFRWVVSATVGQPAWIDLGWGDLGTHRRLAVEVR